MRKSGTVLEQLLKKAQLQQNELASIIKINPSMITRWLKNEPIPHARVIQIIDSLNPSTDEIDLLLGKEPLKLQFRTRGHKERNKGSLDENLIHRINFINEVFVESFFQPITHDLTNFREKLTAINLINDPNAHFALAELIREEFTINRNIPITDDIIQDYLVSQLGINAVFMPFKAIGLTQTDNKPLSDNEEKAAILFNRGSNYFILIDSDRYISSIYFDLLHEIIHILIGETDPLDQEIEKIIDKCVGELCYPINYLKNSLGINSEEDQIKNTKKVTNFFAKVYIDNKTWSPKGLAYALINANLLKPDSLIIKTLLGKFHEFYKSQQRSLSSYGKINFDFKNLEEQINFYENVVKLAPQKYPIFTFLQNKVVKEELSPEDYADIFQMETVDAKVLKDEWDGELILEDIFFEWNQDNK